MSNGGETDSGSGWKKLGPEGRRVAVWATGVGVILLIGTQLMIAFDRDVAWYSGFGQWLGALGSLFAAGVALWIATSDRQRADRAHDTDLAREAGLVRMTIETFTTGGRTRPAVSVRNYRKSRLFEAELGTIETEAVDTDQAGQIDRLWLEKGPGNKSPLQPESVKVTPLEHSDVLWVVFKSGATPIRATFSYTDETGRRWEVVTGSKLARKMQ